MKLPTVITSHHKVYKTSSIRTQSSDIGCILAILAAGYASYKCYTCVVAANAAPPGLSQAAMLACIDYCIAGAGGLAATLPACQSSGGSGGGGGGGSSGRIVQYPL